MAKKQLFLYGCVSLILNKIIYKKNELLKCHLEKRIIWNDRFSVCCESQSISPNICRRCSDKHICFVKSIVGGLSVNHATVLG